jgi:mRNA interferase MazF
VVLIEVPQLGTSAPKLRPALVLALLPGSFQDTLICGISTQLHDLQPNWDELLSPNDSDFRASGLHRPSAIRLSYIYAVASPEIIGVIGQVDAERLQRLRRRLAEFLAG